MLSKLGRFSEFLGYEREHFYENLMNAAVWAISEDDIVEFAKTQGTASALEDWKKKTLDNFCMPRDLTVAIQRL